MKLLLITTTVLLPMIACGDILLNAQGENSPNGKSLKNYWLANLYVMSGEGVSKVNMKVVLDRAEIKEFRSKFPEYANWEAEKHLKKNYFQFQINNYFDLKDFLAKYEKVSPRLKSFYDKCIVKQVSVPNIPPKEREGKDIYTGEYLSRYCLKKIITDGNPINEDELKKYFAGLLNENQKVRIDSVLKLRSIPSGNRNKIIISNILSAYINPDMKVIEAADEVLAFRFSHDIAPLIDIAGGDDPFNAAKACELLGELGLFASTAVPSLKKIALTHREWSVRTAAILALSEIGPPAFDFKDELLKMLDDDNYGIRQAAAKALLIISDSIPEDGPLCHKIIDSGLGKSNPFYLELKDKICKGF